VWTPPQDSFLEATGRCLNKFRKVSTESIVTRTEDTLSTASRKIRQNHKPHTLLDVLHQL